MEKTQVHLTENTKAEKPSDSEDPEKKLESATLIVGYQASLEQNKLYAEFRWRVVSYITTLQAGLLVLVINAESYPQKIVCSIIGIAISVLLWMLEKRHHQLFTQCRNAGRGFEDALGIGKLGVFSNQINQKKGMGHQDLIYTVTALIILLWIVNLFNSIISYL